MCQKIVNPDGLHDPTPFGYSHTVGIRAGTGLVFVSGQYGSDVNGEVVSPDFERQVQQTFDNLATALAGHGLELRDVVRLGTYVVGLDFDRLGLISGAVQARWGDALPTQTLLGVAALATPEILFEIEAVAVRP